MRVLRSTPTLMARPRMQAVEMLRRLPDNAGTQAVWRVLAD